MGQSFLLSHSGYLCLVPGEGCNISDMGHLSLAIGQRFCLCYVGYPSLVAGQGLVAWSLIILLVIWDHELHIL